MPRTALFPWALLATLAASRAALAHARQGMTVTFLAVGQGDSAVVQFPGGGAMLIDAGGDLRWPGKFDPGARDVVPALAELGVRRLDAVVLTHPHPDHAGCLLTVLDRLAVGELWMTPERGRAPHREGSPCGSRTTWTSAACASRWLRASRKDAR